MNKDNPIDQLIYIFSKLPGLGQRSARRIVLHLLQEKDIRLKAIIEGLIFAVDNIIKCSICGNLDSNEKSDICNICASSSRDNNIIAVVESVAELWAIERSGTFNGKYHVLNGTLSAINGKNPSNLKIPELLLRCQLHNIKELIIATNATMEGRTTAYYIIEYFKNENIKISKLASGIPIGGELDYLDEGTLSAAISSRQPFD